MHGIVQINKGVRCPSVTGIYWDEVEVVLGIFS